MVSPTRVTYLDVTGSGNETSAHLAENGRITFMFGVFEGAPVILRLYGRGCVVLPNSHKWDELVTHFVLIPGARQIIRCGYLSSEDLLRYEHPFLLLFRRKVNHSGETIQSPGTLRYAAYVRLHYERPNFEEKQQHNRGERYHVDL